MYLFAFYFVLFISIYIIFISSYKFYLLYIKSSGPNKFLLQKSTKNAVKIKH